MQIDHHGVTVDHAIGYSTIQYRIGIGHQSSHYHWTEVSLNRAGISWGKKYADRAIVGLENPGHGGLKSRIAIGSWCAARGTTESANSTWRLDGIWVFK